MSEQGMLKHSTVNPKAFPEKEKIKFLTNQDSIK
jgi:hypothetical protein